MAQHIKRLALLALLLAAPVSLSAQETGRIIGRVLNGTSSGPVSGAVVRLADGSAGTLSDLNGRFILPNVSVGLVSITVESLGYATKTVTDVPVNANQMSALDITIEESALELSGITVSATAEKGSVAAVLNTRRSSSSMVEVVGASEISRRPDSDAADVAQRMAGVTVTDGKYVFVRGLGGRYSQTSLNGSSLPSPEPEREVVPLDLFPAGFLESLTTQKSYSPDLPADFSGGSVQIRTQDFPNRFVMRAGVSSSFNSNSAFKDGFMTYVGGGRDWTGFDDGTRAQPAVVERLLGGISSGERLPSNNSELLEIGQAFQALSRPFTPVMQTTPINRSFNLSVGGSFLMGDDQDRELGYFLAGTYSDHYGIRNNEIERKWRASGFNPAIPADQRDPNVDYVFNRGTRDISWGAIGNLTYKFSPTQKVSFRTTINLSTEDEARRYEGANQEDIGGTVRADRLRFVERLLAWNQMEGEHQLFGENRIEWRLTAAQADRDEPLLQESVYMREDEGDPFLLLDVGDSGRYFWSDLVDKDLSAAFDWSVPFELFDRDASFKFGGAWRERTRDFAARRLNWDFLPGIYGDIDTALQSATIVTNVRNVGEFAIKDLVEPGDLYDASDERLAGYLLVDLGLTDHLQAIVGARVEQYDLGLNSRGNQLTSVARTDLAPSLNLIYSVGENVKVRAAASKTVDRPEFRELAPFQFTEATSLRQVFGNQDLVPADIVSADLRVDYFPSPGEILSVGVFMKEMTNPIEQVFISAASTAYSFQNADDATVLGIELDARLRLARLSEWLEEFSLSANYSWIDSEVNVRPEGIFQPTNAKRALEGQAAYVLNAGLNYTRGAAEAGVFFNRFGERITAAGGSGLPDIFEQPRNALDATVGFPLMGGVTAKFKATNLLDAEYRFEQEANGIVQVQRLYSAGRTFSVGLSWEF